ncbi:MAG: peptide chain release factor N(5)-glutamine methyltransferase, partial [Desulfobacterales bacterium]|nr:peptide chain release factor N(5)-glutamine methyltransferase [Desulfobacterales bacterium]
ERLQLYLNYDQPCNAEERYRFKAAIKRRIKREPVAYILGHREFWSLALAVDQQVLIPRPETECLVEKALDILATQPDSERQHILELGTGSGAILLALASENGRHTYWGTDISAAAIRVARRNFMHHGLNANIQLVVADWFAPFATRKVLFDMILSNPPYIKTGDFEQLQPEIEAYEPRLALDGSADGLQCLRHIIQTAHRYLKPGGTLLLEMGHDQKAPLEHIIKRCGRYENADFYKDYGGFDRIAAVRKKLS